MTLRGIAGIAAGSVLLFSAACTSDGGEAAEVPDVRGSDSAASEEAIGVDLEVPDEPDPGPEVEVEGPALEEPEEPPNAPDIDITTVPDEITIEYVQAIIDELERILADALVIMMEEGELTIEVTDRVGEIFSLSQVNPRTAAFVELAEDGFPGMRPAAEILPRERSVEAILDVGTNCIYVETDTSDAAFFLDAPQPVQVFVRLELAEAARPVDINPTPWVFASLGIGDPADLRESRPCSE